MPVYICVFMSVAMYVGVGLLAFDFGCLPRWLSILLRQGLSWNPEADNAGSS